MTSRIILKLAAVAAPLALLAACSGASVTSFQSRFEQIQAGDTHGDVVRVAGEPLSTEGWEAAGAGISQLTYIDASATYTFVMAKVPFADARVISKKRVPHFGGSSK